MATLDVDGTNAEVVCCCREFLGPGYAADVEPHLHALRDHIVEGEPPEEKARLLKHFSRSIDEALLCGLVLIWAIRDAQTKEVQAVFLTDVYDDHASIAAIARIEDLRRWPVFIDAALEAMGHGTDRATLIFAGPRDLARRYPHFCVTGSYSNGNVKFERRLRPGTKPKGAIH